LRHVPSPLPPATVTGHMSDGTGSPKSTVRWKMFPANTPMNAPGSAPGVRLSASPPSGARLLAGTGLTRADARRLVMAETMSAFELAGSAPGQPTGQSPFPPIAEYAFLSDCESNCLVAP